MLMNSGEELWLHSRSITVTLLSIRYLMHSIFRDFIASESGLTPFLDLTFASAPAMCRAFTIFKFPFSAAMPRAVTPFFFSK